MVSTPVIRDDLDVAQAAGSSVRPLVRQYYQKIASTMPKLDNPTKLNGVRKLANASKSCSTQVS